MSFVRRKMPLATLSQTDVAVIGRALEAMATGDIVEGFEFGARIGVELPEFQAMVAKWPAWDDADDGSAECLAINNTLNDLLHGVGVTERQCTDLLRIGREELHAVYRRWAASRGWKATGLR
jgi:hypothetical protein